MTANFYKYMNPILQVLSNHEKEESGIKIVDIEKETALLLGINNESNFRLKNGNLLVHDRTNIAIAYMKKAKLIKSEEKGLYKITNEGKRVLKSGAEIDVNFLKKYPSFNKSKKISKTPKKNNGTERRENKIIL
jgi:restriction system protein